ncbi:hypothetical protein H311_03598, partial [Anncaliia algerae PRA109]
SLKLLLFYPMDSESLTVAKELLLSLKTDTTDIKSSGIEEVNMLRGHHLKSDHFSSMRIPISLVNKLCERRIDKASFIQKSSIPPILEGNPVSVQSNSGSGKTIAYTIGILPRIIGDRSAQCLVITPTKELSRQVKEEMTFYADAMQLKVENPVTRNDYTPGKAEIIVGCPGTLLNLIDYFRDIKFVILDEADFLLQPEKMGQETLLILKLIPNAQRLYFSATYSFKIKDLIKSIENGKFLPHFKSDCESRLSYQSRMFLNQSNFIPTKELVTIYDTENKKPEEIKLFHTFVHENEKISFLLKLYDLLPMSQSIIFVNKRSSVDELKKIFENDYYKVSYIHGDMDTETRTKFVNEFSQGKTKILIATDIFSRGMDIPLVNAIINFDLPLSRFGLDTRTYIHRIGRSGRFGRKGFVLDFCSQESDFEAVNKVSKDLSFPK